MRRVIVVISKVCEAASGIDFRSGISGSCGPQVRNILATSPKIEAKRHIEATRCRRRGGIADLDNAGRRAAVSERDPIRIDKAPAEQPDRADNNIRRGRIDREPLIRLYRHVGYWCRDRSSARI